MARSRTSSAWLFLWGALLFAGFRPIGAVERVLDVALVPLRWAAELGSPFALLRAREVAAAERELARAARAEAAEGAETLARLAASALPQDPALRAGRRFLSAEVIERPSKDECWLLLGATAGVERGAPVVCGDGFVGRVVEVRAGAPGLARVELVTERAFRVGAEVRGDDPEGAEPVYLTVGGVRVPRRGEVRSLRLLAHQPSSSALEGGIARVHELFADADDSAGLAEGFRLGAVHHTGERGDFWVAPELDYLDGLFQVAVVLRADARDPAPAAPAVPLADGRWLATRALTSGDPAPWRSTLKIPLGARDGLRAGAAVSGAGARLVGRVVRAGLASSDVALLDDPGFTLTAIARIEGQAEPRVLGRLTTLARGRDGTVRLRWWVRLPLTAAEGDPGAPRRARLFTGSGDPGLPGGLFLGTTWLPARAEAGEEFELVLEPGMDPADVRTLFVRREQSVRP